MEASILDLRYRMRDVLKALDRREQVRILYHGKVKGTIVPSAEHSERTVQEHAFFGMNKEDEKSVDEVMRELRKGSYNAL